MKYIIFLFFLFEITNISYTSAIKQIHQKNKLTNDLEVFEKYLKPPPDTESKPKIEELDNQKLVQCKICQKMFEFEFNYDKLLKNNRKVSDIKKYFNNIINKEKLEEIFKKENLEFLMKEVSMQYFFKGGDIQFNLKNVKENKSSAALKICEEILSYENICTSLKDNNKESSTPNIMTKNKTQQKSDDYNENLIKELLNSNEASLETLLSKLKNSNLKTKLKNEIKSMTQNKHDEQDKLANSNPRFKESLEMSSENEIKSLLKKNTNSNRNRSKKNDQILSFGLEQQGMGPHYKNDISLNNIMGMMQQNTRNFNLNTK